MRGLVALFSFALAGSALGCSFIVDDRLSSRGNGDAGSTGETCTTDAQCISFDPFNCNRTCGDDGHCRTGASAPDGTACGSTGTEICVDATCVTRECGDGYVDRTAATPEYCDDGNTVDTDGCNNACTRSCVAPAPANCDDRDTCNGTETCTGGLCAASGPATAGTTCMDGTVAGVCAAGICVTP
jgi:cysteine-rich repeat protein